MRKINLLPSFSNVVPGSTCTLQVPVGLTYESITLSLTNILPAQLTNIRLNINGKTIQEFLTGTILNALNTYYGRGNAQGYMTIHFRRPEYAHLEDERIYSWGTMDVQTFTIQADIDAACVNPGITAHAIVSEPRPFGVVTKIKNFPITFAVAGAVEIDSIPRSAQRIAAVHLVKADANNVVVEVNSQRVWEMPKALGEELETNSGRIPQTASMTHVDFTLDGDPRHSLQLEGVQDLRFRPTIATPGLLTTVVEYFDEFAGI
jgi:hypothetical protein